MELNFDHTEAGAEHFAAAAYKLTQSGFAGKSVSGYIPSYNAYKSRKDDVTDTLPRADWDNIQASLKDWLETSEASSKSPIIHQDRVEKSVLMRLA